MSTPIPVFDRRPWRRSTAGSFRRAAKGRSKMREVVFRATVPSLDQSRAIAPVGRYV
ncbi:hypothetical protein C8034_v007922 [Colletotrichum sidae]|uniref:Uncharacterized protein n=1 Tax=Colletotrichum sidae TaxID=1347389 RepID=A0A4R8TMW7_9PEZI|nr:hypothetical protein C8034_v007922 [Colletotrichum sidae]